MKKPVLLTAFAIFSLISCSTRKQEKITSQRELFTHRSAAEVHRRAEQFARAREQAVTSLVQSLPLEQKIAQLFLENLEGNRKFFPVESFSSVTDSTEADEPMMAGGYIFFSYNLAQTPEEIMEFTQDINSFAKKNSQLPPFLCIDQEGGFVNRLREISGPLPSAQRVSERLTPQKAGELYSLQAEQMALLGFNLNLSPVAEICTEDNSLFLNQRSFGQKDEVIQYGKECISAYQGHGIGAVLKHFPGNTNTDPHTGLPTITLQKDELEKSIEPFLELAREKPAGILMSHAITSAVDENTPSCLSEYWITEILRKKAGYQGIIFSDDIFMGALADNGFPPETAAVKAIEAGVDCIMISEKRFSKPAKILYQRAKETPGFMALVDRAVERIVRFKLECGLLRIKEQPDGGFLIEPADYPGILHRPEEFEQIKQQNRQLYLDFFY